MTTYQVKLNHPKNKRELDFMHEVALANGDGYTAGSRGVTIHGLSTHGLDRLEAELAGRIASVHVEEA